MYIRFLVSSVLFSCRVICPPSTLCRLSSVRAVPSVFSSCRLFVLRPRYVLRSCRLRQSSARTAGAPFVPYLPSHPVPCLTSLPPWQPREEASGQQRPGSSGRSLPREETLHRAYGVDGRAAGGPGDAGGDLRSSAASHHRQLRGRRHSIHKYQVRPEIVTTVLPSVILPGRDEKKFRPDFAEPEIVVTGSCRDRGRRSRCIIY